MDFANIGASASKCSARLGFTNAGTFDKQNHSLGPTLFWNPSGGEDEDEAKGDGDDKMAGPSAMELSFNVGMQFGLTDATSDTALKFQGSLAF